MGFVLMLDMDKADDAVARSNTIDNFMAMLLMRVELIE